MYRFIFKVVQNNIDLKDNLFNQIAKFHNNKVMKTTHTLKNLIPTLGITLVLAGLVLFSQCTKEDEVTPLTGQDVTGEYTVNTSNGWTVDKSHSSINWKTAYVGDQAWLTGKFTDFGFNIDFDQADLANSSMGAWVKIKSCNTGEPGRDNLGKCLNGYLGLQHNGDTLPGGALDPAGVVAPTDDAYFESTSITEYGDGYKAVGDLTFKGVTKEVVVYFDYITQKDYSAAQDGTNIRASFNATCVMLAKTDFGVTSTSIADEVVLQINAQVKKQ